jgi:hypothetical protein
MNSNPDYLDGNTAAGELRQNIRYRRYGCGKDSVRPAARPSDLRKRMYTCRRRTYGAMRRL